MVLFENTFEAAAVEASVRGFIVNAARLVFFQEVLATSVT